MNLKLDAKAIGGVFSALIISLISWLFRSVQALTNEVAVLKAQIISSDARLEDVLEIVSGQADNIREIIWKIGG
jgi:chorismate-pyruvate lyase